MYQKFSRVFAILLIVGGGILIIAYLTPGVTYESLWPLALIAAGIVWLVPVKKRARPDQY